jgi:hypothetical protein
MKAEELEKIAAGAEHGSTRDPDLVKKMLKGLQVAHPAADADAAALVSADAALELAARALPGWEADLRSPSIGEGGMWTCALREGTMRDDDQLIGIGRSASLPLAISAALIQVAARRARGFR